MPSKRPHTPHKTRSGTRGPEQLPLFHEGSRRERATGRRDRRVIILSVATLVALIALVGGAGYVTHIDRLEVNSVEIAGIERVPETSVRGVFDALVFDRDFHIFSRRNLFIYPKESVAEILLRDLPRIETVHIERTSLLSQAVRITVNEREALHRWCNEKRCYLMDAEGFIFAPSEGEQTQRVFEGGLGPGDPIGQTFLPTKLRHVEALSDALGTVGLELASIVVLSDTELSFRLKDSFEVRVPLAMDQHALEETLLLALQSESLKEDQATLEYIDLRYGNRVYFKHKKAENSSETEKEETRAGSSASLQDEASD